jgi:hypothetical protein
MVLLDLSRQEKPLRFVFAGLSTVGATVVTNPIDVGKTRLQLQAKTEESAAGLYKGFMSAALRESTYSSGRIGLYEPVRDALCGEGRLLRADSIPGRVASGLITGGVAAAVTTPTDLVKVQYQAAGPGAPRPYASLAGAFAAIYRAGGVRALYRGGGSNVLRAMILTGSQIPSYDVIKHAILARGWLEEGRTLHFSASVGAGFVCAITTSPVDVVKSLWMAERNTGRYSSLLDCAMQATRRDPVALYRGVFAQWLRIAPHTIVTFMLLEQLRAAFGLSAI